MNFIEKTIAKKVMGNLTKNLPKIEKTLLDKMPDLSEKYDIAEFENPVLLVKPMKDQGTGKTRLTIFLMVQEQNDPEAHLEYLAGPYTSEHLLEILEDMDIDNINLGI
jgi:hypothetical protein